MVKNLENLEKLRILVTNDDGILAPGIKVLQKAVQSITKDVWVSAPTTEQSATSHSLTIRRPVEVRHLSSRRFAVEGTPTDSVLLAVNHLITGRRPDLVVSGVNRGANLAEDIGYSGTVAAAMEATLLGIPAIAFNQLRHEQHVYWTIAEHYIPVVLEKLRHFDWPSGVLLNVNFPHCPVADVKGIKLTAQGWRAGNVQVHPVKDPTGRPYLWIGDFSDHASRQNGQMDDLTAVDNHYISITPLHLDFTHYPTFKKLQQVFA